VANKRYKTLGFKWLCKVPAPHQSLVYLDRNVARNPQRFHTADRYGQAEKTQADSILQTENKIVNLQEKN
jgi:hypothetical protein